MENSMETPQKLKVESLQDSVIPLLSMSLKDWNHVEYIFVAYVHCTIPNSQVTESTWVSIKGWMDKENVVTLHNGISLHL